MTCCQSSEVVELYDLYYFLLYLSTTVMMMWFYITHSPYPIVNWDFAGAVSIFGPDALPVIHQ